MARETALEKKTRELEEEHANFEEMERRALRAESEREELRDERNHWRDARVPDPEAEALAGCVRALEEMGNGRTLSVNEHAMGMSPGRRLNTIETYGNRTEMSEAAGDHPIGRILIALASRYGVPLVAVPPEPIVIEGRRILSVPAELADQIESMVRNGGFD